MKHHLPQTLFEEWALCIVGLLCCSCSNEDRELFQCSSSNVTVVHTDAQWEYNERGECEGGIPATVDGGQAAGVYPALSPLSC